MVDTILAAIIAAQGAFSAALIGWVGKTTSDLYARLRSLEQDNESIRLKNIAILTWASDMIRQYIAWSRDDAPPPPPLPEGD